MDMLPELTTDILQRIQIAESVLSSKCVSREWRTILGDKRIGLLFGVTPRIGKDKVTQLFYREEDFSGIVTANNHDAPNDETHVDWTMLHPLVGSCNGLVCFYVSHHDIQDPVYIMNPETGEHLHLPELCIPITPDRVVSWYPRNNIIGGFGYSQRTDEYKVVRIHMDGKVQIHTLGDKRGWRNMAKEIPYIFRNSGVYAHGCIFWLDCCQQDVGIISFNLDTETFHQHLPPPHQITGNDFRMNTYPSLGMVMFGVRILFYYIHDGIERPRLDLWAPISGKNIHTWAPDGKLNWKYKTSIYFEGDEWPTCNPIAFVNDKDILFWKSRRLMRYNTLTSTWTEIWGALRWETRVAIIPHMRSAVSLKNFGGQSEACTHDVHDANTFLGLSM